MKFLTCLFGFRGSQAQMSAMLAFILIFGALLDLICGNYTSITGTNIKHWYEFIKYWYVFNLCCLLLGLIEIANIRGKIKSYIVIHGLRFIQYMLMLLSIAKTGIEFFTHKIVHTSDIMVPIFILVLVFVLNAREAYQESKTNGISFKSYH